MLLLGAPGAGKTTLGTALEAEDEDTVFLNVGGELRKMGLVDDYFASPSEAKLKRMKAAGRSILDVCVRACPVNKTLVVECVKDLDDAHTLLEVLEEHGVELRAVFYIASSVHPLSDAYSIQHQVTLRTPKWSAQAPALIELFSSLGVLFEITNGLVLTSAAVETTRRVIVVSFMPPVRATTPAGFGAVGGPGWPPRPDVPSRAWRVRC